MLAWLSRLTEVGEFIWPSHTAWFSPYAVPGIAPRFSLAFTVTLTAAPAAAAWDGEVNAGTMPTAVMASTAAEAASQRGRRVLNTAGRYMTVLSGQGLPRSVLVRGACGGISLTFRSAVSSSARAPLAGQCQPPARRPFPR